jgi:hypothetical protein
MKEIIMSKSCTCEDRPCCGCGQEYMNGLRSEPFDRYDSEDEFVDRLMTDDEFYDRVVGWF